MSFLYVANADSQSLTVLFLDAALTLQNDSTVALQVPAQTGRSIVLASSPDRRLLYAAYLRDGQFAVATLAVNSATGALHCLDVAPLADTVAYMSTDRSGRFLLCASYAGDKVMVNAIRPNGTVGELLQSLPTAPKAHCILIDATNRHVLYTSLGGDLVYQQQFDATHGQIGSARAAPLASPPGSGPRFLAFGLGERFVYVNGELDGSVAVHAFDAATGTLGPCVQRLSALPPGFTGKPWAADLKLTPDGRHLYVSERTGSTIAAFAVDRASGELELTGFVPGPRQPRALGMDPAGRFLAAAGQLSDSVQLYAIDPGSGALSPCAERAVGRNPTWIEFLA